MSSLMTASKRLEQEWLPLNHGDIVRHKETRKDYVLLGGGFGVYKAKSPSPLFGNFVPLQEEGESPMVCVCNPKGHIGWFDSDELLVISVDGQPVSDIIQ